MSERRILVTSALPYANGPIHIGHLVEYIQTDIWVRFQRMRGHETYYVGADDTHGTPVMLRAEKEGLTPRQLIERVWTEHKRDFDNFLVSFDNYYSTDSDENKELCQNVYLKLKEAGLIDVREVEQFYDPVKEMFLPDRFIKGECPKCGAKDQYGDSCEVCGATYQPTDLKNPYSVVSGATPVRKSSEHYFFKLSDPRCENFLRDWVADLAQPEATNKMREWLGEEGEAKLSDWDISRDAPYFGFEIPGAPGKYFYVWLDAPVGYYASFKNLCAKRGLDFDAWINEHSTTEQYHFIGKDILYFHTLFWPAMLKFSGHRTPTNVFAHGFLTVDGAKMSKSRGTFITAQSYIDTGLNPEWLRYYFAAKLNATMEDLDLNLDDFIARVNSDLVGKFVNIASRSAGFLVKRFEGRVSDAALGHPLMVQLREAAPQIADLYEKREYSKALRAVMELADAVNAFVDTEKPWDLAKDEAHREKLHAACSVALEA
ncbi:MAG: methionine--tRNA ligase, partial [Ralstonia sp.]|nr:methionine--tRNA ligase [Ralstonia sp.]